MFHDRTDGPAVADSPETEQSLLPTADILLLHHIQPQQRPLKTAKLSCSRPRTADKKPWQGDRWGFMGRCRVVLFPTVKERPRRMSVAAAVAVPRRGAFPWFVVCIVSRWPVAAAEERRVKSTATAHAHACVCVCSSVSAGCVTPPDEQQKTPTCRRVPSFTAFKKFPGCSFVLLLITVWLINMWILIFGTLQKEVLLLVCNH